MQTSRAIPWEKRQVVLFRPLQSEFLLKQGPEGLSIPEVSLPGHQRICANLRAYVKKRWNLDVVSIGELAPGLAGHHQPSTRYELLEILGTPGLPETGLMRVPASDLPSVRLAASEHRAVLEQIVLNLGRLPLCGEPGPFAHFGWLAEVKGWVAEKLWEKGLHLTGPFEQFTAGASFSLLRMETTQETAWFKAVGVPNLHEFTITAELTRTLPQFVPPVLAWHPDWHAWLSLQVTGTCLGDHGNVERWYAAAKALAQLQIRSQPHASSVLAAGARDVSVPSLISQIDPFFETLENLMRKQVKSSPAPLCPSELDATRLRLQEVLSRLGEMEIPNTLGHLDLNPGNVLVGDSRCTFLDWAEAAVGPAFLTLQYFLEHFHLAFPERGEQQNQFVGAYTDEWRAVLPETKIQRAMQLLPAATVYAYTTAAMAGRDPESLEQAATASSIRSMGRRLRHELLALEGTVAVV